jgi:hypothetical protein
MTAIPILSLFLMLELGMHRAACMATIFATAAISVMFVGTLTA